MHMKQSGARSHCVWQSDKVVEHWSVMTAEKAMGRWRGWLGSNQRPLASEANTLSTELQPHVGVQRVSEGYSFSLPASMVTIAGAILF